MHGPLNIRLKAVVLKWRICMWCLAESATMKVKHTVLPITLPYLLIPHGKHFSDAVKRLVENKTLNAQVVGYRFQNLKTLLVQQSLPIPPYINFIFWRMCFATYS